MQSSAETVQAYLEGLPEAQKQAVIRLRDLLMATLVPMGFEEMMQYGMISYVVPYSIYPPGYHCKPKQPLPFVSLAGQKQYVALYHMGIYADQDLLSWFQSQYLERMGKAVDMGKSCIRFKKPEAIPFDLIRALAEKMSPQDWIERYERIKP